MTGQEAAFIDGNWVSAYYIDHKESNGEVIEYIIYNGLVYHEDSDGVIRRITNKRPEDVGYKTKDSNKDSNKASAFDFKSLFEGIGSLFSGIGNFTSSLTGKGAATNNNYYSGGSGSGSGSGEDSKTGTYLLYGGLLLFVVLIMFLLLKK